MSATTIETGTEELLCEIEDRVATIMLNVAEQKSMHTSESA